MVALTFGVCKPTTFRKADSAGPEMTSHAVAGFTARGAKTLWPPRRARAVAPMIPLSGSVHFQRGRGGIEMKRIGMGCVVFLLAAGAAAEAQTNKAIYKDAQAPVEQRVEDLLGRMTLEEKIAQITAVWTNKKDVFDAQLNFDAAKAGKLFPNGIGQFTRPSDLTGTGNPLKTPYRDAKATVDLVNAIQRFQTKNTRLGIPTLFHEEG